MYGTPAAEIVPRFPIAPAALAAAPWYNFMTKVKPPRTRYGDRAPASPGRADRADPLDMQVSAIRTLIDKLRSREESVSPLTDRTRSAPPRARVRKVSSRPRRALPSALATTVAHPAASPSSRPRVDDPSAIESRLLPICERLEGVLGRIEARLESAPASADELLPLDPECTLRGRITDALLPDLLQMVTSNRWTGVFVATDGAFECRLYFDEGQACHAEAPGTSGEGAFFAALALEQGEYHFLETPLPADKTISSNTQFLILEALRQIDEAKGG